MLASLRQNRKKSKNHCNWWWVIWMIWNIQLYLYVNCFHLFEFSWFVCQNLWQNLRIIILKIFLTGKKFRELKIIRIFAVNPFSIPWCIKIFQGKSLKFLFAKVSARKVYSFCKPSKFNNMWNQKEKTTERLIERHLIVKFRIYFTYCSGASIVDFEQVNASCVKNQISNQYYFQHL